MKIGIMQPYFLPYIGYWQLMNAVDKYVIYDDVQYIRRGWISRNRILVDGQAHYFNISLTRADQTAQIRDMEVRHDPAMTAGRLKTLEYAYRRAPYYPQVLPLAEEILAFEERGLVSYLVHSFKVICRYIGIGTEFVLSSAIAKRPGLKGQEKILDICGCLGAAEYYNAIGGQELYSSGAFQERGIGLKFLETDEICYGQFRNQFVPSLSILDVMMFNSKEEICRMLGRYSLLDGAEGTAGSGSGLLTEGSR